MNYSHFLDDKADLILQEDADIKKKTFRAINLEKIEKLLDILENYSKTSHKRLNIIKMFNKLNIPAEQRQPYLHIILRFQNLFCNLFSNHSLHIVSSQGRLYFSIKKGKIPTKNPVCINSLPEEIRITQQEISLLNDIVYMFTKVKRGKGFNLQKTNSEIMKGIKFLRKNHPYLFFSNGHGIVYPTEFALKLGEKVNSYMKCNRRVKNVSVDNTIIIIKW